MEGAGMWGWKQADGRRRYVRVEIGGWQAQVCRSGDEP